MTTTYKPDDHEERMAFARRVAQYEIGDPSWADTMLDAYWDSMGDTGDDEDD